MITLQNMYGSNFIMSTAALAGLAFTSSSNDLIYFVNYAPNTQFIYPLLNSGVSYPSGSKFVVGIQGSYDPVSVSVGNSTVNTSLTLIVGSYTNATVNTNIEMFYGDLSVSTQDTLYVNTPAYSTTLMAIKSGYITGGVATGAPASTNLAAYNTSLSIALNTTGGIAVIYGGATAPGVISNTTIPDTITWTNATAAGFVEQANVGNTNSGAELCQAYSTLSGNNVITLSTNTINFGYGTSMVGAVWT